MIDDTRDPRGMTKEELIEELMWARRFLYATGRSMWPTEEILRWMEGIQNDMADKYDAENAKDPQ